MTDASHAVVEVFQNEYLAAGATVVDAVVTVTLGANGGGPAGARSAAEVIMIDRSGSMSGRLLSEARKAAAVAVDALRDGVRFAIVAGDGQAIMVYPGRPDLEVATAETRAAAKDAIGRIRAGGSTDFGCWLRLARELFLRQPTEIRHAILLTDGHDGGSAATLRAVLDSCAGVFGCDSRGVGAGWSAAQLMIIADALLGTADGMKDPAGLADDFRAMIETAMGKTLANASLRIWTPSGARVRFVKQMHPEILDLTGRRTDVDPRTGDYPTGSWGAESRDYHLSVELAADAVGAVGEERLAARASLVRQDEILAKGLVRAVWTDDAAYSTKINVRVARCTGEAELAAAIQEGILAREAGDTATATARLGRAVQLATESGRSDTVRLLSTVLEIKDARTGTVRLKRSSDNRDVDIDAEMIAIGSRKTTRVRPS